MRILLLLLLLLPVTATPTYQCFHHDDANAYILINRRNGNFIAEDCDSGFRLSGDGLLKFKSAKDRSFTLTFDVVRDGRHYLGDFTLDGSDGSFAGSIDGGDGTGITYLIVTDRLSPDDIDTCSCSAGK